MRTRFGQIWDEYTMHIMRELYIDIDRIEYTPLMLYLNTLPFEYVIDMDENRAVDGIMILREPYFDDKGMACPEIDCTVLEMLAALAIRLDNEYVGEPNNPAPGGIFWEFLINLGLVGAGKFIGPDPDRRKIDDILEKWMSRNFDYDGNGSIFPVENASRDQRTIEIWDQKNEYMNKYWL